MDFQTMAFLIPDLFKDTHLSYGNIVLEVLPSLTIYLLIFKKVYLSLKPTWRSCFFSFSLAWPKTKAEPPNIQQ